MLVLLLFAVFCQACPIHNSMVNRCVQCSGEASSLQRSGLLPASSLSVLFVCFASAKMALHLTFRVRKF